MKTARWIALLAFVLLVVPSHDASGWGGGPWSTPGPASNPFLGAYGDGSDGNAAFDGVTTVTGATLASGNYTLTRDVAYLNATVGINLTGVTLTTNGWRLFVQNNLTVVNAASAISNAGPLCPVAQQAGKASASSNTLGNFGSLGNGGGGANNGVGSAGASEMHSYGGGGAAGGSATNAGGAAGTVTAPTALEGTAHHAFVAIVGSEMAGAAAFANPIQGGAGGGGGGSAVAGAIGGGGGGGGGILGVYAFNIVNNGTFTVKGGQGCAGSGTGAAGGGGGGGGGVIFVVSHSCAPAGVGCAPGNANFAGGGGGVGSGGGNAGGNGAAGSFFFLTN